jgi:DNA recombination protein RmuC
MDTGLVVVLVGLAAAVGLLLGLLLARQRAVAERDRERSARDAEDIHQRAVHAAELERLRLEHAAEQERLRCGQAEEAERLRGEQAALAERLRAQAATDAEAVALLHGEAVGALAAERDRLRDELVATIGLLTEARVKLDTWQTAHAAGLVSEAERRRDIENQFEALARKVVSAQSEEFLKNAGATLEQRSAAIAASLLPFKEQLEKLAAGTQALETKREGAYGEIRQQLLALAQTTQSLQASSTTLLTALRSGSSARGRWGEMQLQNIAELAGMTKHCDFETQVVLADGSRPDMIVKLPGVDGRIPVDAKVPMDAYMRALETADPAVRAAELLAHAAALRKHVLELGKRDYAAALGARVDFTILFVPGEPILAAAFESAPELQAEAMERRVLIVTPVTLVALLRTVALYWQQQNLAQNAQLLWDEAREFHKRVTVFFRHFEGLGGALDSAIDKYNKAVGSYEKKVLPQGRKLEELAPPATDADGLPDIAPIDEQVRTLSAGRREQAALDFGAGNATSAS